MITNYKHHLYPKQSEFVKYRGKTGQIDVKDTIIAILAHKPGLTHYQISDLIYHPDLEKSRRLNIPCALDSLSYDGTVYQETESGQYYLHSDALSHDIGKTQDIMSQLTELGLPRELVTFLSSAIIMAGEEARAEHDELNYNSNDTVASSPAMVPPIKEEVHVSISSIEHCEQFELIEPIEDIAIANPFENMSAEDIKHLADETLRQVIEEQKAAELEEARLQMEEEDRIAAIAIEDERIRAEQAKINEENAYKNKLSGIKSATALLGLDVEISMTELNGQVIGTILELRPDSVLFLIVFSRDAAYAEGSIHTLYYKDNLSYKIMA